MSYSVENINNCTKKIIFNFETLDLATEIKLAVVKKQKSVSLKGFRKGKAPLDMVKNMYGPQIETDALNNFINNQYIEAVTKEDLKVVGYPEFENMKYEKGSSVSFDALVEVFPEIQLKDMKGLSFSREKVEVTEDDLKTAKNNYLSSKSELIELNDENTTLEKGQTAIFNFEGELEDGSRPEDMKGQDYVLEIGSGQFIPGFEEKMIGLKKGENKTIDLIFPEDYHAENLKSAKVKFHIEVLEIKEKKVPEFTDELAKEFGYESIEDFKTKNTKTLNLQKNKAADEKLHQEILEKLTAENTFDIPKTMIKKQEESLMEDVKKNLQQQGFTDEMANEYLSKGHGDLHTKAEFQVKSGIILDTLAREFKIETGEADLEEKIKETAENANLTVEEIRSYYTSNDQMKKNILYSLRQEKTFLKIKEIITIK